MDAVTLYEHSHQAFQARRKVTPSGLPPRLIGALIRAGFGTWGAGALSQDNLDQARIRAAVESGEIWAVRHIGPKSVSLLCVWLTEPDKEEP